MTKKLLFVLTIALVATFALMAAGVDGKWVYEQAGRQGGNPVQVTLMLKADGTTLTGSTTRPGRGGGDPMVSSIKDGKVDGNNVSFKTSQSMGGNDVTIEYTGVVTGDELKLKIVRPGRDGSPQTTEVTAKRSTT
jgi:hypothetical protein